MSKSTEFLSPAQLSARWGGSPTVGTLANQRAAGEGPPFVKIGKLVKYRLADVEQWERRGVPPPDNDDNQAAKAAA